MSKNQIIFDFATCITELCLLMYQYKKGGGVGDASGNNSTDACRGNWWQGIIVGILSSTLKAPLDETSNSCIKDLTPFFMQGRFIIEILS